MKLKNINFFFLHFLTTGHLEVVNYLLDNGSKIDAKSRSGRTPLYCAAFNGHFEVVKCLIENGANVNAKDNDEYTPLHEAAGCGSIRIVKMILDNVEEKNPNDKFKNTILFFFAIFLFSFKPA